MKTTIRSLAVAIIVSATFYTPLVASATTVSLNLNAQFSGYMDYGAPGQFSAASANWVIPKVTCSSGRVTYVSQWVGIEDGVTVAQDGVDYDCNSGTTQPTYLAWYEIYGPDPAVDPDVYAPTKDLIESGDVMRASVNFVSGEWKFCVEDLSRHWQFFAWASQSSPPNTRTVADFLLEGAVPSSKGFVPLSRFRSTSFYDARVTSGGVSSPAGSVRNQAVAQTAGKRLLVTPGALSSTGTSFIDTMVADN